MIYVFRILLEAGADLKAKDLDGWTPMHAAAHWGQEEACKILTDNLCDLDAKNNGVSTFWHLLITNLVSENSSSSAVVLSRLCGRRGSLGRMNWQEEIDTEQRVIRELHGSKTWMG